MIVVGMQPRKPEQACRNVDSAEFTKGQLESQCGIVPKGGAIT